MRKLSLKFVQSRSSALSVLFVFLTALPQSTEASLFFKDSVKTKAVHGKCQGMEYELLTFLENSKVTGKVATKYPLLLALPGSGEAPGDVLEKWREGGAAKKRMMVLVPDWLEFYRDKKITEDFFLKLIAEISAKYPVDSSRLFIAGTSAGGGPVQKLVSNRAVPWRGAVFIAFVPSMDWIKPLSHHKVKTPLLLAYGRQDPGDRLKTLLDNARVLKEAKYPFSLIVDPDAAHEFRESWVPVILNWMDGQMRQAVVRDKR